MVARKPKTFTREQVRSRKDKAVRFTREVIGEPERAEEIESESVDDYAARRHMSLSNPERRYTVPSKTPAHYRSEIADLKEEIRQLEDENEELQGQFDRISEIASGEDDEGGGEGGDGEDEIDDLDPGCGDADED